MSGNVGASSIYHTRLPYQWNLERIPQSLSRDAKRRFEWIKFYAKVGNARLTCRHYHISPTTLYRWLARYERRGLAGLESLSRAPKRRRMPATPWEQVDLVVRIRGEFPAWSKHKIAVVLERDHGVRLSVSTVGRILKRKGLYAKTGNKHRKAMRRRARRLRAERFLRDAYPGSLVQIDTKRLIYGGRTYYQFSAVDCFSRLAFARVYSRGTSANASHFLAEVACYMPFSIHALQSDNGSEFLGCFEEATDGAGLAHYFTRPYCPKQNGRVEKYIQSSEQEHWDFHAGFSCEELNLLCQRWNLQYNRVRPHQALGYLTPLEFFRKWEEQQESVGVSTM